MSEQVWQIARPSPDVLGEGPMWSEREQALYWVDIFGRAINRLRFQDSAISRWNVEERIGWIVEREARPGFLIGLKSGFAALRLDPFVVEAIGNPEADRPHNRLNDAKVDRLGRLWAGSKDDTEAEATGALYRLDRDLTWTRCDDGYMVANGPAFSLDGNTCYHSDSGRRLVYAYDVGADGNLSNRRVFVRFEESWGYPDGMTVDARGGLWVAHWDGARISRFHPTGERDYSIAIPTARVTSMTFAGPELDRMFVTTASYGRESDRNAGALYEVRTGERGVASVPFCG